MYGKASKGCAPSDGQAREKLALYVYEYLLHVGAQKSAQTFLSEVSQHLSPPLGLPTLSCAVQLVVGSLLRARSSLCLFPIDPLGKEHHLGRASWLPALLVVRLLGSVLRSARPQGGL